MQIHGLFLQSKKDFFQVVNKIIRNEIIVISKYLIFFFPAACREKFSRAD